MEPCLLNIPRSRQTACDEARTTLDLAITSPFMLPNRLLKSGTTAASVRNHGRRSAACVREGRVTPHPPLSKFRLSSFMLQNTKPNFGRRLTPTDRESGQVNDFHGNEQTGTLRPSVAESVSWLWCWAGTQRHALLPKAANVVQAHRTQTIPLQAQWGPSSKLGRAADDTNIYGPAVEETQ